MDAAGVVIELVEIALEPEEATGGSFLEEGIEEDETVASLEVAFEAEEVGAALEELEGPGQAGVVVELAHDLTGDGVVAREGIAETDHEVRFHGSAVPPQATGSGPASSRALAGKAAAARRRMVNVVPWPTVLSTAMLP